MVRPDVLERLHPRLELRARELAGTPWDGDDLLQAVYEEYLLRQPRWQGEAKLHRWFRTVLYARAMERHSTFEAAWKQPAEAA